MPEAILRTLDLGFHFRADQPLIQNLNLTVERGSIYGFLGPNGAGKTTTIRLILALLRPQSGRVEVFGQELREHRTASFRRIGALIEQPSLYGHLSGEQNLEIARRYTGAERGRIEEVLELVGLSEARHKKARAYSLGMKQRLGLAMALLHRPELLILDEPTNGLDPSGIIEMRELIRRLAQEWGTTVFLSSHLLAEIERTCTHVGIIHQGQLRFQGTLDDLKTAQSQRAVLHVETNDPQRAMGLLGEQYAAAPLAGAWITVPYESRQQVAAINRHLIAGGLDVYELSVRQRDLEDSFLEITR
jgi:ABC-type multidrug transport system ATPase subunit